MYRRVVSILHNLSLIQRIIWGCISTVLIIAALFFFMSEKEAYLYNVDFSTIAQETSDGMNYYLLRGLSLPKGHYEINVGYYSDDQADVEISLGNSVYHREKLQSTGPEGGVRSFKYDLSYGTDRGRIDFSCGKDTDLRLVFINIVSDRPIYKDGIIWGVLLLLLIPVIWMIFYFYNKSTHKLSLLCALFLVVIQIMPFLLIDGMPLGIDSKGHMMRIEGIYYGLLDGQFPVVVYPEWNNSYGQIGVLYPNIFLYIPALMRLLGMSQLGVCKFHMMIVTAASVLIALAASRSLFKREWQMILCMMLLSLENIRLWDMLYRGRIGGAFIAEMFLPLLATGLVELIFQNRRKWYLVAYGLAGIICCHVTTSTVAVLGSALFMLFSVCRYRKRKVFREAGYALALFTGLILGTAVCFVYFFFGSWGQDNLQWRDFAETLFRISGTEDGLKWISVFVTAILSAVGLVTVFLRRRFDLLRESFAIPMFAAASVLLWMSTAAFPWELLRRVSFIRYYTDMLQSGDRFLSVAACMYALCLPAIMEAVVMTIEGRRTYASKTALVTIATVMILTGFNYVFNEYTFFKSPDREILYYDTIIGEVEIEAEDYLPEGTQTEWYRSDTGYISDEEAVDSLGYERQGTHIYYTYTNRREGAYVEFPEFYYRGYTAEDERGEAVDVICGDRNRTRVYLKKTDDPAKIRLWYKVPAAMTVTVIFSLLLWAISILAVLRRVYKRID